MSYSLTQFQTLILQQADMPTTGGFVTLNELRDYINDSAFELQDLIVAAYQDTLTTGVAFSTVAGTASYAPAGLAVILKFLRLDVNFDGYLVPINKLVSSSAVLPTTAASWTRGDPPRYHIGGSGIFFSPTPNAVYSCNASIIARITRLVNAAETFNTSPSGGAMESWEEFIIVDGVIKCLRKQNDPDLPLWLAQKASLVERIKNAAQPPDWSRQDEMVDLRYGGNARRGERWWP